MTSGLHAATAADPSGTRELSVEFQFRKDTFQSSIAVWNKERNELLGHSCSSKLAIFEDGYVSFDVDQNGRGDITIGPLTYLVHDDAKFSGGIVCNRMNSKTESLVTCAVHVPKAAKLPLLSKRGLDACFNGNPLRLEGVLRGLKRGPKWLPAPSIAAVAPVNSSSLVEGPEIDKRQGSCGTWSSTTHRVGDGNPHQNPMNIRLSVRRTPAPIFR